MIHLDFSRRWFVTGLAAAAAGSLALSAMAPAAARVTPNKPEQNKAAPGKVVYSSQIGQTRQYTTKAEDTLIDLARRFKLGFTELVAANPGVDPWLPGDGTVIVLPTGHLLPDAPHQGLVLNLIDQRLYYFPPGGGQVETYALGTGREAWNTPLGATSVVRKKRNPTWHVPKSIRAENPELPRVVGPGPKNPLGRFAMYLGWPGYLVHGTNNPWGVGRRVSHGCIRMYPEDIKSLFPRIPVGTPVTVVSQEIKIARFAGQLLLEIHPSPSQTDELEAKGKLTPSDVPELAYKVVNAAGKDVSRINWEIVRRAARERSGVPINILKSKAEATVSGN